MALHLKSWRVYVCVLWISSLLDLISASLPKLQYLFSTSMSGIFVQAAHQNYRTCGACSKNAMKRVIFLILHPKWLLKRVIWQHGQVAFSREAWTRENFFVEAVIDKWLYYQSTDKQSGTNCFRLCLLCFLTSTAFFCHPLGFCSDRYTDTWISFAKIRDIDMWNEIYSKVDLPTSSRQLPTWTNFNHGIHAAAATVAMLVAALAVVQ